MKAKEGRKARDSKLLSGLLSAALVVSLVPTNALAESIEEIPADAAPVAAEAAAGEGIEVANDGAAGEAAQSEATPADEGAVEVVADDATATTQDDTKVNEEQPVEKKTDEAKSDEKKEDAKEGTVYYIKRDWNGSEVTKSTEPCNEAKPLPKDGKLAGGWHVLDADATYKKRMEVTGDTQLILGDGHTLKANAGIYVAQGATLTIYSEPGESGKLVADADTGAGIGAYSGHKGGDVVICGGTVEAHGGGHCAGIGSNDGDLTEVGSCTIYGGTVTATGGKCGAGIGGGQASEGGHITIYGGDVTGKGGHYAAGIGGGNGIDHPVKGAHAGTIEIYGGKVTGKGGDDGAGIGGGEGGNAGSITINGGEVTGIATNHAAGIGCGEAESTGNGGTVTINGGKVEGKGGNDGAGIGGGDGGVCEVVIAGGDVTGRGKEDGAGIGSGEDADDDDMVVKISGGTVNAHGDKQGAAIGGGNNTDGGKITISGGTTTAHAGKEGAGIGGGESGDGGTITISGGTVISEDAQCGAAIGGGNDGGNGGKTTISGGDVHAQSYYGAGIGGGQGSPATDKFILGMEYHNSGEGGTIVVKGGTVHANSVWAFGIGAGAGDDYIQRDTREIGSAGHITINGGHTEASGSLAGIGGDSGTIDIKKGDVKAESGASSYNQAFTGNEASRAGNGIILFDDDGKVNISGGIVRAENAFTSTCSAIYCKTINVTGGDVYACGYHRGIGGGGTLTVSGKDASVTVEVQDWMGRDSERCDYCIGNPDEKMNVVVKDGAWLEACFDPRCTPSKNAQTMCLKSLKVYDEAKCWVGDSVVVDNREKAMRDAGAQMVSISPCKHENATCEEYGSGHVWHCKECKAKFGVEDHCYDEDLECTKCGHKVEGADILVTFDPANGEASYKMAVTRGNKFGPSKEPKAERPDLVLKGWYVVDENGNTTDQAFDFSKYPKKSMTLRAVWMSTTPTCKETELLEKGRMGVIYKMELPEYEGSDWSGSYMEFKVGGKNAKAIKVPFEETIEMSGDCRGFVCPVNAAQMADHIEATFHYDGTSMAVEAPDGLDSIIALADVFQSYNEPYFNALRDYGHYSQVVLAKEKGWTIGEDGDHMPIEAATAFDEATIADAKEGMASVEPIEVRKGDTVSSIKVAAELGSETSLRVTFKTNEQVKKLVVDGREVDPSRAKKVDGAWVVVVDGIRAMELDEAHSVSLTTTGEGNTTSVVEKVSPLAYAGSILSSDQYADDVDAQYAAAALYRFWKQS